MDCNNVTLTSINNTATNPQGSLDWAWLDNYKFESVEYMSPVAYADPITLYLLIPRTTINCDLNGSKAWVNRLAFIKSFVADILASPCSKEDPFVLVSFGAGFLMMEALIAEALIRNGFHNLRIYPVDIVYCNKYHKKHIKQLTKDFKAHISSVYHTQVKAPLPENSVHFFSRGEKMASYHHFPSNANVAFMECFPSYGLAWKKNQRLDTIFLGNIVTPIEEANSLMLVDDSIMNCFKKIDVRGGIYSFIPHSEYQDQNDNPLHINWGCKIHSSGQYHVSFLGSEKFLPNFESDVSGVKVPISAGKSEILTTVVSAILRDGISNIQKGDLKRKISQVEKSSLLAQVHSYLHPLNMHIFFLADYSIDREELLEFLKEKAGHHYRRAHCLKSETYEKAVIEKSEL